MTVPFEVFVNGIPQHPGVDFDQVGRRLVFRRELAREGRLGFWRWASMLFGVAGTYRRQRHASTSSSAARAAAAGDQPRPDRHDGPTDGLTAGLGFPRSWRPSRKHSPGASSCASRRSSRPAGPCRSCCRCSCSLSLFLRTRAAPRRLLDRRGHLRRDRPRALDVDPAPAAPGRLAAGLLHAARPLDPPLRRRRRGDPHALARLRARLHPARLLRRPRRLRAHARASSARSSPRSTRS